MKFGRLRGLFRSLAAAIVHTVGPDEFWLGVGLALLGVGCWHVWRPAAFLAPGLVLIWIFLPQRVAFLAPGPRDEKRSRD